MKGSLAKLTDLERTRKKHGGRDRDRTDDLYRVKVALVPTELRAQIRGKDTESLIGCQPSRLRWRNASVTGAIAGGMGSHDECAFCIHRGFSSLEHLPTTNATSAFVVAIKRFPP